MKSYYVYIVTNRKRSVLYTGITNNLEGRIIQHYLRRGKRKTFAGRYRCHHLVYYETFEFVDDAIAREKYIKSKSRAWKEAIIEEMNPSWASFNYRFFKVWPPEDELIRFM